MEPAKSREVLPSEAPYETDNQREERKRLLRRGSKGYIESLFAPKGCGESGAETAQVGFRDSRVEQGMSALSFVCVCVPWKKISPHIIPRLQPNFR